MLWRLSKWRPAHLLLAWCTYWLALPFLWFAPALPTLYRISKPDQHGRADLGLGDHGLRFAVEQAGQLVHVQTASLTAVTLAIAVPPLVLWALWLRAQRRAADRVSV
jgi:hypothetical protein